MLPLLAADLRVSAAEAALTISLATVGLALTVLPWSFLADRIGRVRAMMWGISAATVLGLLVPLAPSFPVLLCLRMLEGMALGGIPAIAIAYLNEEVNKAHAAARRRELCRRDHPGRPGRPAGRRAGGRTVGMAGRGPGGLRSGHRERQSCSWFSCRGPRASPPRPRAASAGPFARWPAMRRNPRLLALYVQAFLLMGGFVAVYNYLGFRLSGEPFSLPATAISLIFLAYLSGTVSARWAAGLTSRFGRRTVLIAGTALMAGGLALTLTEQLAAILAGLLLFTGGFFAAHSIGSGWTGLIATTGRAQAASLYNLAYYLGSSVLGWAGGLVFQRFGWTALALTVIGLAGATAAITAVAHPAPAPATGHRAAAGRVTASRLGTGPAAAATA